MKALDRLLQGSKLPNVIHRSPSTFDDFSQWKASELRAFLLFLYAPIFAEFLPQVYMEHLALLSNSVFILLEANIQRRRVYHAQQMLELFLFVLDIQRLYGERYPTFNVHSLLHPTSKVQDLGPLWAHSWFFFEDLNGDLRTLFTVLTTYKSK